jgi:hypothetical protein
VDDRDIAQLAKQAGFTGQARIDAVAVALAESHGKPDAHNKVPPDDSYGLWQINMRGSLGPERRKQFGIAKNEALFNPEINAKAAHSVYVDAGNSFRPWSTYVNQAFRLFLPRARKAVEQTGGIEAQPEGPVGPDIDLTPDSIGDAVRMLAGAGKWIGDRHNWVRIIQVGVGGVLLVVGVTRLAGAGGLVTAATPAGAATKIARSVT